MDGVILPKLWEQKDYQLYLRDALRGFRPHIEAAQAGMQLVLNFQPLETGYTYALFNMLHPRVKVEFQALLTQTNNALFREIGFDPMYYTRFTDIQEAARETQAELQRCLDSSEKDLKAMWFNGMLFGRFEEVVPGGYYYFIIPGKLKKRGGGK